MAKAGIVNSNLLSKEEVNQLVGEIDILPYSNAIEAIEYSKPSVYTNNTLLLYVLSLPKVTEERFNHLITRANVQKGHRIELAYKTILISKQETFGIRGDCLHLSSAMVCEKKSLDLLPEAGCLARLLKGGETSCPYLTSNASTVEVIKDDTIFLNNFVGNISSGKTTTNLNGSYILRVDNETVVINNQTYSSITTSGVQVLPPILTSVTNRTMAINLDLVHGMAIDNLQILKHLKSETNWFILSEGSGLLLLMVIIWFIWRKLTARIHLPEIKIENQLSRRIEKRPSSPNLRDADI
ncbi:uncharacterized protein LOC128870463 [Anastrepha ludens]|uniref:uncharacterized protein LOC128870463 n=1 Tax=Anastrepha ludens TaxID=28586 RepID=UPI0023AFCD27|nr:uncharacterized protein LOC128870463 [Anastrepha ludens]